ncbi:MAG: ABC transporter ATP-binding protein [Bacilli bacterium]|jgi:putative ABC transport system ATP-binding protein|nr:ABC transporter ATP-binding protein [Bacilli bacterium]
MEPLIEAKRITKDFLQKEEVVHALAETSFVGFPGEFVAVIGPSGSGKSTFLTILGGLQKPTTGEILLEGAPYSRLEAKSRSRIRFEKIGFILQSSSLVPFLTVAEQLRLYDRLRRRPHDEARIAELSKRLGVGKLLGKLPNQLSGGERQRAAIMKALYPDPSLILADEPTASLDRLKSQEVMELLRAETKRENKLTIMVTHDERFLDMCDRVCEIEDGVLSESRPQS